MAIQEKTSAIFASQSLGQVALQMDLSDKIFGAFNVLLMFFCAWFIYFCTTDSTKPEKEYLLQKIDEDGTQWFVRMTHREHSVWAARRYENINVKILED